MRISDWSSDVCSSDLGGKADGAKAGGGAQARPCSGDRTGASETGCGAVPYAGGTAGRKPVDRKGSGSRGVRNLHQSGSPFRAADQDCLGRSEEHTSELQSLMRIQYAVFCLKIKNETLTT